MESDLQVTVKGDLPVDLANRLGAAVADLIHHFAKPEFGLDLRRLHQIIVPKDYRKELAEFHEANRRGGAAHHTSESYAEGVAQVLLTRSASGEFVITPIISASIIVAIVEDESSPEEKSAFIHAFHHELCHVHDDNQKIDAMPEVLLQVCLAGKAYYTYGPALLCWAEYFACHKSASTVTGVNIGNHEDAVLQSIRDAEVRCDAAIASFKLSGEIQPVHVTVTKYGDLVARMCAYLLGYADGLGTTIQEIAPQAADAINRSLLRDCIAKLHSVLISMRECYPGAWGDMSVYDDLAGVMEDIFAALGIELRDQDDGGIWVQVLH